VRSCRRVLRPGMPVVVVGADVGYYSRLFSQWVGPQGLVLAFEPHPANFDILRRNVERARLRNVRLFPFAVSDREGTATLWQTPLSSGHSLHPVKPEAGRPLALPTVSLDVVCRSEGVSRVDLVKMDVEGGEPEVLKGMAGLASRSPRLAILMEFKAELLARRDYDPAQVLQTLSGFGCSDLWALRERGRTRSMRPDQVDVLVSLRKCNLLACKPGAADGHLPR
jgi:FkbM family methyltransferase